MNDDLNRIFLKGGVTSPGELKDCIAMLESVGLSHVHFGSRQDLLFPNGHTGEELSGPLSGFNTNIVAQRTYQNIVSSYVSADIFDMTHWLKGSTYLYILEQFDYMPTLKINITDPKQRLVPPFSGNLNYVASAQEDYWYLYIDIPHWQRPAYYPVLVYSWAIVEISRTIEEVFESTASVEDLFHILNQKLDVNSKKMERPLRVPYIKFPYYEGMNRMGLDKYWLGLYWRNNRYDLDFLKDFCGFCLDNTIGKICITPWKSFIVKGIRQESRPELERFLGQRGINVRHSQLEMNWHLPVDDREALELKNFLVQNFDRNDISTYGLTFGISKDPGKRSHFASVIIEINTKPVVSEDYKIRATYNVLHFRNFDPNTLQYESYAQEVDKTELPGLLMELSKKYFMQLGTVAVKVNKTPKPKNEDLREVYQCPSCYTVYDPSIGDPNKHIEPGTPFSELPPSYSCPVCGSAISGFKKASLRFEI